MREGEESRSFSCQFAQAEIEETKRSRTKGGDPTVLTVRELQCNFRGAEEGVTLQIRKKRDLGANFSLQGQRRGKGAKANREGWAVDAKKRFA